MTNDLQDEQNREIIEEIKKKRLKSNYNGSNESKLDNLEEIKELKPSFNVSNQPKLDNLFASVNVTLNKSKSLNKKSELKFNSHNVLFNQMNSSIPRPTRVIEVEHKQPLPTSRYMVPDEIQFNYSKDTLAQPMVQLSESKVPTEGYLRGAQGYHILVCMW